ncbi:MAG: ABC transporter permease [Malacoplasma sp.]
MSNNLYNSYHKLVSEGNLHDFVVNEKYTLGYSDYTYGTETYNLSATDPTNSNITVNIRPSFNPSANNPNVPENPNAPTNWTDSYKNFYDTNKDKPEYALLLKQNVIEYKWNATLNPLPPVTPPPTVDANQYFTQTILPQVEIKINSMKNELIDLTQEFIKTTFDTFLNGLNVTYRRFNSIDVNNTKQSIFYKLIETSPSYNIDNLVIYEGNNVTKPINYNDEIFRLFNTDTNLYSRRLLALLNRTDWSQNSILAAFNAAYNYFNLPANINLNPYTIPTTSITGANKANVIKGINYLRNIYDNKQYNLKGFRINFSIPEFIPISGTIEDFSSYESVVSPSFLDKANKSIFPLDMWTKHLNDSQVEFQKWFNTIDGKYKYSIDETEYIILGSGISPDFMYPIVSFDSPVPNYDKEAIIYANKNGYERTLDAFRGNNQEEFIVGKFNDINEANVLLDKINLEAETIMSWPYKTKAAYFAHDINNILSPTTLRLQFIPQILDIVQLVTVFLSLFIWILSIIISILVIKRFIETNKNSLGIMLANGFKKREIITSIVLFLMIPILLSIVLGFFLGFILQAPAVLIFSNLWVIPINLAYFSPLYFIIIVLFQAVLFAILSFFFSWYSLRGNIAELMKDETKYKLSRISIFMKRPFMKTGIMNTFRASVAFSSIWRLLLLSFMSSLVMLSFSFVLSTNNKFNEAAAATYKTRNYSYALKLITPSNEGGQYYAVPYNYSGMTLKSGKYFNTSPIDIVTNPPNTLMSQDYLTNSLYSNPAVKFTQWQKNYIEKYGNYHLISSTDDKDGQEKDLLYLKYKSQNKILLDHFLGAFGIGANPWQIAAKLMPNNQINHSNQSFRKILEEIILDTTTTKISLGTGVAKTYREHLLSFTKTTSLNYEESAQVFADRFDINNIQYREFNSSKIQFVVNLLQQQIVLKPDFIQFFLEVFNNEKYRSNQYNVMFGKVGIDETDRPFTYIDFTFSKINNHNYETSVTDTIFGINKKGSNIDDDVNAVELINSSNQVVNDKLFIFDNNPDPKYTPEYIPIIINEFAKKKYDLFIGADFEINVNNKMDRYNPIASAMTKEKIKFKVVDSIKSYQNSEFFVSQNNANYILGLHRGFNNKEEYDYSLSGFNGIYSFQPSIPQITNGISLYSPSGLYPAYDTFSSSSKELIALLGEKYDSNTTNLEKAREITHMTVEEAQDAQQFLDKLVSRYGSSSVYAVLNNVIDRDSSKSVFDTLAQTISSIQISVMITIIIVTLVIVVLISTMIVFDSIKLASFLKCLGLNDRDNALSFLMIYGPVFFIGLIIAIPLIYIINFLYVETIFQQASILLVVNLSFTNILVPIFSILIVFFISYLLAWYKIRGTNLPQIIK